MTPNTLRAALVAGLAFLVGMIGGCDVLPKAGLVPISGEAVEGAPAVDIQIHTGSVKVIVDPKVAAPMVQAMAASNGVVKADTTGHWVAASMASDAGRPVLRVLSAPVDGVSANVDITVTLPACSGVRVHCDTGPVELRDVAGAIEVRTSVTDSLLPAIVVDTGADLADPVLLTADAGSIELRMGRKSAGNLTASARGGKVNVDGIHADVRGLKFMKNQWTGVVNGGTADMRLMTESGDVMVILGARH